MAEKHLERVESVGPPALGAVRVMLHGVKLSDLPEGLRKKLARYDRNGNGIIDEDELPLADDNDAISIKAFPPGVRKSIAVFDSDGDGSVKMDELIRAADMYHASKQQSRRLLVVASVLLLVLCATVGIMAGLTAVIVEESKETTVNGKGELVNKDNGKTLATKSSEFSVEGGNLPGAMERSDGTLVGAAQAYANATSISSGFEDGFFRELRYLSMTGRDGAYLHLQVLGFVRLPARGRCGSTVLLYTMAGQVELDDTTITFDEETAATFADAGFSSAELEGSVTTTTRRRSRRLLGLTSILGFLNAVKDWDFECNDSKRLTPTTPGVVTTYRAVMDVMYPCNMSATFGERGSCLDETGGYRPGYVRRNGGNHSIVVRTELAVMGAKKRRTTKTYPHMPDISLVDVRNQETGLDFAFQLDITGNYGEERRPHACEYTDYKRNMCKNVNKDPAYCGMGVQQRKDFYKDELPTYANANYVRETSIDGLRVYEFSFVESHKVVKVFKNFTNGNDPSTYSESMLHETASVYFHWESLDPYALKYHDNGLEVVFVRYQVGEAAKVLPSEFAYPKCHGEDEDEEHEHHNGTTTRAKKKAIDYEVPDSPYPEIHGDEEEKSFDWMDLAVTPFVGPANASDILAASNSSRRNLLEHNEKAARRKLAGRNLARSGRHEEARRVQAATDENVATHKKKREEARAKSDAAKAKKQAARDAGAEKAGADGSPTRRKLAEEPRQCYNIDKVTKQYDTNAPLAATISKYGRELSIYYGVDDADNEASGGCYNLADLPFPFSPCGTNYVETCDTYEDEDCDGTPTDAYLEIFDENDFAGQVKRFKIPDTVQQGTPYEITMSDYSIYEDGVITCSGTIKLYDSENREGEVLELAAYDGADHLLTDHAYAPDACSATTDAGVRLRFWNEDDYAGTMWEYWGSEADNTCQDFAKANGGNGGNDKMNSFKIAQLNDCGEVHLCKNAGCGGECVAHTEGKTLNSYANKYSSWMWHHATWWKKPLSIEAPPGCTLKFYAADDDFSNRDDNKKKTWNTGPGAPYSDNFDGWSVGNMVRITVEQDDTEYSSSSTWNNAISSLTVPAGCILEYKISSGNSWNSDEELHGDSEDCTRCKYGGEDGLAANEVGDGHGNDIYAIRIHQDKRTWGHVWAREADDQDGFGNLYNLPNNCGFRMYKEENCDESGNYWTRYWDHSHLPDLPDSRPLMKSVRLIHNEREDDYLDTDKACSVPNKGYTTCGLSDDMCKPYPMDSMCGYMGLPCYYSYLYMDSEGDTSLFPCDFGDNPLSVFNFELGFDGDTGLPCSIDFEVTIDTKDIVAVTKALPLAAYVTGNFNIQTYNDYTGLTSAMGCINIGLEVGYDPLITLDLEIGSLCIGYLETEIPSHAQHTHSDPSEKYPAAFAKLKLWPLTRLGGVWLTAQITAFPQEVDGSAHVVLDLCAGFKVWYVFGSKDVFSTCISDNKYSSFNTVFIQHLDIDDTVSLLTSAS